MGGDSRYGVDACSTGLDFQAFDSIRVAACLSLSRSYFSHLFTDEIGLNPCTYLNNLRLERSLEFLNNQDVPIKSIAKEVGFDNPLYFSQVFKKKYGLCPSEFRKQCLQKQANYYDG